MGLKFAAPMFMLLLIDLLAYGEMNFAMMNKLRYTDCALAHIRVLFDQRDSDQGQRILKRIDVVKHVTLKELPCGIAPKPVCA